MKTYIALILGLFCQLCLAGSLYNIIPEPAEVTPGTGTTKNLSVIRAQKTAGLGDEGYTMDITPGGVIIQFSTPDGRAMATATLFQLRDQLSDTPQGIP